MRKYVPETDKAKGLLSNAREEALIHYIGQISEMTPKERYDFRRGFEFGVGWLLDQPEEVQDNLIG